jgi:hypothetical protein
LSSPEPQPKIILMMKLRTKGQIANVPPGQKMIAAEKAEKLTVCQHSSKPHVACCANRKVSSCNLFIFLF